MNATLKTARFVTLLLTGLSAGVAFAHLLELPNKMALSAQDYLLVQQHIYEGFGRVLGVVEPVALLTAIVIAVLVRKRRVPFLLTLFAVACLTIALVVWQLYNGPVNDAVALWTAATMPSDWMTYRDRWEYAHATRAVLYTVGFGALILSVLTDTQASRRISDSLH
jgi:hypothetical protein